MVRRIKRNRAQCRKCGDVIESRDRWGFVTCGCGSIIVAGGTDHLRRVGEPGDVIELAELEGEPKRG